MGNAQSPPADPLFDTASRAFSTQELEDLKSLFVSLAAQSGRNAKFVSQSVFQAIYEKGARDEIEEFIYRLCDVTGDGILGRSDIEAVINSINECLFYPKSDGTGLTSHQDVLEVFVNAAQFSEKVEGSTEESMSLADFRSWCILVPSARKFLGSLLMPPDSGRPDYQVPTLHHPEDIPSEMLILRKEYAWHIGGALSQDEVEDWKLLYHSGINGLSFSTFLGNLSNGDGPTVLIIKDNEGFVYGGYASQPWDRQSDFYGDMKCFLYQLYPKASIFRPTGANNNLQWCAVNFSSDCIPNGIGFGGRANHFGLFLSANFDQGHTFPCTTFSSPCLSKTSKIHPEVIECWGVIAKGPQNGKPEVLKGTVLERFKEDRNMLKMTKISFSRYGCINCNTTKPRSDESWLLSGDAILSLNWFLPTPLLFKNYRLINDFLGEEKHASEIAKVLNILA